jgi:hypothetical protein
MWHFLLHKRKAGDKERLDTKKRENSVGNRIWNGNNHAWETEKEKQKTRTEGVEVDLATYAHEL